MYKKCTLTCTPWRPQPMPEKRLSIGSLVCNFRMSSCRDAGGNRRPCSARRSVSGGRSSDRICLIASRSCSSGTRYLPASTSLDRGLTPLRDICLRMSSLVPCANSSICCRLSVACTCCLRTSHSSKTCLFPWSHSLSRRGNSHGNIPTSGRKPGTTASTLIQVCGKSLRKTAIFPGGVHGDEPQARPARSRTTLTDLCMAYSRKKPRIWAMQAMNPRESKLFCLGTRVPLHNACASWSTRSMRLQTVYALTSTVLEHVRGEKSCASA